MKKTYGVCFGMLAMGLAVLGAPVSRAQSRMAAAGAGGATRDKHYDRGSRSRSVESSGSGPSHRSTRDGVTGIENRACGKEGSRTGACALWQPRRRPLKISRRRRRRSRVLLGPTSVSGFVDGYYQVNFNHPNQATTERLFRR